jgi:hypothetical protein
VRVSPISEHRFLGVLPPFSTFVLKKEKTNRFLMFHSSCATTLLFLVKARLKISFGSNFHPLYLTCFKKILDRLIKTDR